MNYTPSSKTEAKYYCHTVVILYYMSSIVTSILSSTVGLWWNKARDKTTKYMAWDYARY